MFAHKADEVTVHIDNNKPDYFVLYDDGFNYLTKMCLTNMRDAAFEMIKIAKAKGCTVVISSSDSTDHYEQYLAAGADLVLLGEAEYTLLDVINAIKDGGKNFAAIQGIAYIHNNNIIKTVRRNVIKELDSLPMPAWDLVNMQPYKQMWLKKAGYFSINMATTRGCPYKCNWCAKPIYGNRYNSRSAANVIAEIKLLQNMFQFDHIWFCDDIFGLKPGWVHEFADISEKEDLKFKFKIQSRADLLLQEDYVTSLARAGCDNVWMGAESGSQKILDAMDKGITVQQIQTAAQLLKSHKIKPSLFIQFGYLGENLMDIKKTIEMINEVLPYSIGISVSYPLPGTLFYEKVKQDLKEKTNWTDSDEMMMMFHNTYPPKFYKQLHQYVQKNYRLHLAFDHIKKLFKSPSAFSMAGIKKILSIVYYIPLVIIAKLKLQALERPVLNT